MIDLTGDSDADPPEIDHITTLRAKILRGFFDRSQSKSPTKVTTPAATKSSQSSSSFLDMIRARRGFSVTARPPEDVGAGEDAGIRVEDDVSSTKTHESSMEDAEVGFFLNFHVLITHSFI